MICEIPQWETSMRRSPMDECDRFTYTVRCSTETAIGTFTVNVAAFAGFESPPAAPPEPLAGIGTLPIGDVYECVNCARAELAASAAAQTMTMIFLDVMGMPFGSIDRLKLTA